MIENQEIAKEVIEVLDECSEKINQTINLVRDKCSTKEYQDYRKAAAFIMGYIYTEVVGPLHQAHPDLEPPELKV